MNDLINQTGRILPVKVIVTVKNGLPAVELRTLTTNQYLIKNIVSAAWHDTPLIIAPFFPDKFKGLNSCIEKGILYLDPKDNKYYFTAL